MNGHVESDLVGFQLGAVDDTERAQIEAHLIGCASCLAEFFALKRAVETASGEASVSAAAALRLRVAVADALSGGQKPWAWWSRPLALGFSAIAVAGAISAVQLVASRPGAPPAGVSAR